LALYGFHKPCVHAERKTDSGPPRGSPESNSIAGGDYGLVKKRIIGML
jgi:hypothetical protein